MISFAFHKAFHGIRIDILDYMGGYYVLVGFNLEIWKFGKNSHFLCQIWPDWGYATWADMAGLGSKGIKCSGLGPLSAKLEYLPN